MPVTVARDLARCHAHEVLRTARYHFRATLRSRWRTYAGGIVLLAMLGGVSMAAVAGARRTASAYQRFLADSKAPTMVFDAGGYDAEIADAIGRFPEVADTATYVGLNGAPLDEDGRPNLEGPDAELLGSVDGRFFRMDRPAVVDGRLPNPDRADEAAVNESLAGDGDIAIGDTVTLGIYTDAQAEQDDFADNPPEPSGQGTITVVGVVAFGDEIVQGDAERFGRVLVTPAFTKPNLEFGSYAWQAITLKRGDPDVAAVQARIRAMLPEGAQALFRLTSADVNRTQRAVRPLALALGVFGLLTALATVVLVGQAVVRAVWLQEADAVVLRSLGTSPRLLAALSLAGPLLMVAAGAGAAVAVALALSPLAPLGTARRIEVSPGVAVDWTVLAGGVALFGTTLLAAMALATLHQSGRRRARPAQQSGRCPSRVVAVAAASGAPAPVVAGTRMALEGAGGAPGAPSHTRSAMTGAVLAAVALASSLCFGASLRSLVDHPRLYGWDWDVALDDNVGYGSIDLEQAHAVLDDDRDVESWAPVAFGSASLDGADTPLLGVDPTNPLVPPILDGRRVQAEGEVVLGPDTLAALGKGVGDHVLLDDGTSLTIVGTATFPSVGPLRGSLTSLGTGGIVPTSVIPSFSKDQTDNGEAPTNDLFLRLANGVDIDAVGARLVKALDGAGLYPGSIRVQKVQRPAEIVNNQSMGLAPAVLAATVAAAVLVSLALALTASVRRERRELALLKVLGFTRRQLGWTVVANATVIAVVGLAVGLPLGVMLGRWLWVLFARQLSVVPEPSVPVVVLLAVAAAVLVLSSLVATVPAALASRTRTADVLRRD